MAATNSIMLVATVAAGALCASGRFDTSSLGAFVQLGYGVGHGFGELLYLYSDLMKVTDSALRVQQLIERQPLIDIDAGSTLAAGSPFCGASYRCATCTSATARARSARCSVAPTSW